MPVKLLDGATSSADDVDVGTTASLLTQDVSVSADSNIKYFIIISFD
jgi:hypothetical protein